jgi:hypothetical protein
VFTLPESNDSPHDDETSARHAEFTWFSLPEGTPETPNASHHTNMVSESIEQLLMSLHSNMDADLQG